MSIYKTWSLKWWQTGLFKITLISLGLLIASYWTGSSDLQTLWWILTVVPGIYITYVWWKQ